MSWRPNAGVPAGSAGLGIGDLPRPAASRVRRRNSSPAPRRVRPRSGPPVRRRVGDLTERQIRSGLAGLPDELTSMISDFAWGTERPPPVHDEDSQIEAIIFDRFSTGMPVSEGGIDYTRRMFYTQIKPYYTRRWNSVIEYIENLLFDYNNGNFVGSEKSLAILIKAKLVYFKRKVDLMRGLFLAQHPYIRTFMDEVVFRVRAFEQDMLHDLFVDNDIRFTYPLVNRFN